MTAIGATTPPAPIFADVDVDPAEYLPEVSQRLNQLDFTPQLGKTAPAPSVMSVDGEVSRFAKAPPEAEAVDELFVGVDFVSTDPTFEVSHDVVAQSLGELLAAAWSTQG